MAGNLECVSKQLLKKACHPLVRNYIHLMVIMKCKCKFTDFFYHLFLIISFDSVCKQETVTEGVLIKCFKK